jgi:hypothetical protein
VGATIPAQSATSVVRNARGASLHPALGGALQGPDRPNEGDVRRGGFTSGGCVYIFCAPRVTRVGALLRNEVAGGACAPGESLLTFWLATV